MTRRRVYIYKESHLPSEGWLQGCFGCVGITGSCQVYKRHDGIEYIVYLCDRCVSYLKDDDELRTIYETKVDRYIRSHFEPS